MKKKLFRLVLVMVLGVMALIAALPEQAPAAEAPFVEDGVLKKSRTDNDGVEKVIAVDVDRIIATTGDATGVLYASKKEPGNFGGGVWFVNLITGEKTEISNSAIEARMSEDGNAFVIWKSDHTIIYRNGKVGDWKQIGIHGAAPIISHDGKYVLYEKLADQSPDGDSQGLFEFAKGIALYDVRTSEERLLTNSEHGEDFAPVGLSVDGKIVYFNSTRASDKGSLVIHNAAVWAVDIDGSNIRQLTNTDATSVDDIVPTIDRGALWASDRTTVVSSYFGEGKVWKFNFLPNGVVDAVQIAEGDQPRWAIKDKQIVIRARESGKTKWKKLDLTQ